MRESAMTAKPAARVQHPAAEHWQRRFRTLGALMPSGLLVLTGAGAILYRNRAALALLGALPGEASPAGWLWRVQGEDRAEALASWRAAVSAGQPWERRLRVLAPGDNQEHWLQCRASPAPDLDEATWTGEGTGGASTEQNGRAWPPSEFRPHAATGEPTWIVVLQDVSEMARVEQRRERFMASTFDFVAELNLATLAFKRANPAFVRALGYDPSAEPAAPNWGAIHPADSAAANANAIKLRQGLPLQFELRHLHRDGSYRLLAWTVYPVLEQGVAFGIGRDLTPQARIAAEHLRLASVVEQGGDLMAIANRDGAIVYMNRAGLDLAGWHGYAGDQRIEELFPAPARAGLAGAIRRALDGGEPWQAQPDIVHRQSGELIPVHAKAFPIHLPDDTLACGFIARDMRDWRRAEAAFRNNDKLAAMGRVAAAVAHEINNPLAAAVNLAFLLGAEPAMPERTRPLLQQLEQELGRVAALSKQTLSYFRPLPAVAALPLSELAASVCKAFRARAAASGAEIHCDLAANVLVPGSANELRQVLMNILGNALDAVSASRAKRICLRLRTVGAASHARFARLSIADSGPGLQSDLGRLFEPFYSTKGANGSGLGLWVSREIVQKHNGSIQCRNLPGGGACFSILLPLS